MTPLAENAYPYDDDLHRRAQDAALEAILKAREVIGQQVSAETLACVATDAAAVILRAERCSWVPVSERLPKPYTDDVLFITADLGGDTPHVGEWCNEEDYWICRRESCGGEKPYHNVTHWLDGVPELPEPEESDG